MIPCTMHDSSGYGEMNLALRPPIRYGSDACCLISVDARYASETVRLRNDLRVNRFIHASALTEEAHLEWLAAQALRRDAFNFVILVNGKFAGTASLYDVVHGENAQFGRFVMPDDGRRTFAIAAEFLCLSFAFDVLRLREVWCRVAAENSSTQSFHLRNGWRHAAAYDTSDSDAMGANLGLTITQSDWPQAISAKAAILDRLHKLKLEK